MSVVVVVKHVTFDMHAVHTTTTVMTMMMMIMLMTTADTDDDDGDNEDDDNDDDDDGELEPALARRATPVRVAVRLGRRPSCRHSTSFVRPNADGQKMLVMMMLVMMIMMMMV